MSVTFYPATQTAEYIDFIEGPAADAVSVNLSNVNAAHVLDTLGLLDPEGDLTGHRTAEQFLGAVLLAIAIAPADDGVPAYQVAPNFYDCGRHPGYTEERLGQLRALAEFCAAHGHLIAWA
jgi:hypothetical protein